MADIGLCGLTQMTTYIAAQQGKPQCQSVTVDLKSGENLWRGGLPPLGRAAALKPANALYQAHRVHRLYDCCAAERGQALMPFS
jgi:hypothetical protein